MLISGAVLFLIVSSSIYYYYNYKIVPAFEKDMKAMAANIFTFEKNWQKDTGGFLSVAPADASTFLVKNNLANPTTKLTCRVSSDGPNNVSIYVYPDFKKTVRWFYAPLVYIYRINNSKEEQGFMVYNGRLVTKTP